MGINYATGYYDEIGGSSSHSAGEVVPHVLRFVTPASVVDVGCGIGAWLSEFRKRGAQEVLGLDGPWVRPDQLQIRPDEFQVVDLAGSLKIGRRFDLVVNLEVAEHLPAAAAQSHVASLVGLGDTILFSAAIPLQGGEHHVNEQWPEYWAALFAVHGFCFVDCLRFRIWSNPNVAWWYAQNIFLVVKKSVIEQSPELSRAAKENDGKPLAIVHPRAYVENAARGKPATKLAMATLGALRRRIVGRR